MTTNQSAPDDAELGQLLREAGSAYDPEASRR